jgi:hypothetical protein
MYVFAIIYSENIKKERFPLEARSLKERRFAMETILTGVLLVSSFVTTYASLVFMITSWAFMNMPRPKSSEAAVYRFREVIMNFFATLIGLGLLLLLLASAAVSMPEFACVGCVAAIITGIPFNIKRYKNIIKLSDIELEQLMSKFPVI